MKAKHVVAVAVYMLILFIVIAVFASQYAANKAEEKKYADIIVQTEVPTSGYEVNVSNKTEEPVTEDKLTWEFYPAPDTYLDFSKGLIINPDESYVLNDIKQAQLDEANLLVIELYHNIDANETPSILNTDWKSHAQQMINEAHRDGLLVELRFTSKRGSRFEGPDDFDNYLSKTKKFFKEMGDFAEEHQVYRFTIYTEANDMYHWEDYENRINNITQEILISAKHYYNGKVGIGFTYESLVKDRLNPNIKDYDYLVVGRYPTGREKEISVTTYTSELRNLIVRGREVAKAHGVFNMTLGFFGLNTDQTPAFYCPITATELEERDFYVAAIDEFSPQVEAITINYITEMYGIDGNSAEYKVTEKFSEL